MRSNSVKQSSNSHQSKSKKVMQYVNLISTHQTDKNKTHLEKTIPSNKSCNNHKSQLSKDFSSNANKALNDKCKPSIKSDKEVKKHNRSKTEYLDPPFHDSYTLDFLESRPFWSKLNAKKKDLQRQESKNRLKTQSLKLLNPLNHQKSSSSRTKQNINIKKFKQSQSSKEKSQKIIKKKQSKNIECQDKFIETAISDLKVLRQKFRREKSDLSEQNQRLNLIGKDKQVDKSKKDSKNMTLLNLSQILHNNEYSEDIIANQKSARRRQIKSDLSKQLNNKQSSSLKIKEIYYNLTQRIDFMAQSVDEEVQRKNSCKNGYAIQRLNKDTYNLEGRSFSFMKPGKGDVNIKHGKSNFSTGVDSVGLDDEVQQLIKLKLRAQKQICHQISKDLQDAKGIHEQCLKHQISHISKPKLNKDSDHEKSSARTFRQINTQENPVVTEELFSGETSLLLGFVEKYHRMTQKMLPFIFQLLQANPQVISLNEIPQRSSMKQGGLGTKQNQKFIEKYNDISQKNATYQQILNQLIHDGVNVEKYMNSCLSKRK